MQAATGTALPAETMTSAEAAGLLGVTTRQVQRLATSGQLVKRGVVGRAILLDTGSVLRLARTGIGRGRQWSAATVWTASILLTTHDDRTGFDRGAFERRLVEAGLRPPDASRLWHVHTRLRSMPPAELVRMARGRARVSRWRVAASYAEQLGTHLVLTGTDAVAHDRGIAGRFGLAAGGTATVDGYLTAEELPKLQRKFFLTPAVDGTVTLRTLPDGITRSAAIGHPPAGRSLTTAAPAVVALDLAESLDPRERAAGLRVLGELMDNL
jgi:hypothetical protein